MNARTFALCAACLFFFGFIATASDKHPNEETRTLKTTARELSSKVVNTIISNGRVEKIEGKNITLRQSGDALAVKVRDDAKIYSYSIPAGNAISKPATLQKEIKFEDIKVGDDVTINLKISADNRLEGYIIFDVVTVAGKK